MVIFLCLTTIIRKQWVENEKLSYPIIQIPFEITARSGAMFGKRLSIIGFAIPVAIGLINGLHGVLPSVPQIVTDYDLNVYFTQKPWNALGSMPIRFNSLMIGIAFLLPLGLLFSCVFFYFINKAQLQIGSAAGVQNVPGYPFFVGLAIGETLMSCFWAIRSVVFHTTSRGIKIWVTRLICGTMWRPIQAGPCLDTRSFGIMQANSVEDQSDIATSNYRNISVDIEPRKRIIVT